MHAVPADPLVLALPEQAGLHHAADLMATLSEALARNGPLRIDSSAVRQVDLATLQILVAAHRQAARDGIPLEVSVPAGGLLATALADYGFLAAADARLAITDETWTAVQTETEQAE